jgi:hypothetical protein
MTKPEAQGRFASRPSPARGHAARLRRVEAELADARRELAEFELRYELLHKMYAWRNAAPRRLGRA